MYLKENGIVIMLVSFTINSVKPLETRIVR